MRKTIAVAGWSVFLSWIVMFIAFFGQMATTAASHYESTPTNPISVFLIGGILAAAIVTIIIGHISK